ncbi:MAG TPA: alanine transaminase [Thermodesulfobacteriota bacterium]|nr:alanine transaminase [Thermodesulfobacteriota bacterium]
MGPKAPSRPEVPVPPRAAAGVAGSDRPAALRPPADFPRIGRLPPYVFAVINDLKTRARRAGEDVVDLGMGNPDLPTPPHIVAKLVEAAQNPRNHRYSASRGIPNLRKAIADWYARRYDVHLDPETEAIATIGAKEGLAHLTLACLGPGDTVVVPDPTYPIHTYAPVIAGADVRRVPLAADRDFFADLQATVRQTWPTPKMLILSFPANPTTAVVDRAFFEQVVAFAREHGIWVVHDLAYADLVFDGYRAPSILEVPGAIEVAVEFFTLSKSYSMPGWRVGFCVGNPTLVQALARIKSYFDYGMFQPIQIAATVALNGPQECVREIVETYRRRRDALCAGLARIGWPVEPPRATMFVWAPIPEPFRAMGSLEFATLLIREAKVAVSPGIGFGHTGDGHVRFALIENEERIRQAVRGIGAVLRRRALARAGDGEVRP